ncbi:MAG: hypothetical protein IT270_15535 [Saprospiraceae bacterium]|nr:hypothetical protein [Saprospiraceae bacterium]
MQSTALFMMLLANIVVIAITGYFFMRVLRSGPPDHADEDDANFPRGG